MAIHLIQQGKGGVGKSMIAAMLYQALEHFGKTVAAFDIDPVNATLAGFKEFKVTRLDVLEGGNIHPRKFDALVDAICELPPETHAIVDSGASSFLALNKYLIGSDVLRLFSESGHTVFFHTVVTGGQAIGDTVVGLHSLAVGFPEYPIVVWLNPFFGDISIDGRPFEEFKVYQECHNQFHAVVTIPEGDRETIGKDLEILFAKRQSFKTGMQSSQSLVVRSRLNRYWNNLLEMVDRAAIAV
jgi:hypothetical protein